MNVNAESHFAVAPADVDFKRSQFDRSHSHTTTFNVGELIPFYLSEVLPGDTFDVSTSKVVRLQTLLKPVMDNLYLDTYYFFVPNRLIWDHWQAFCGESNQAWTPSVEYSVPQITFPVTTDEHCGWNFGSLADYLGVPPNDGSSAFSFIDGDTLPSINALPFRAYAKICEDWFRDQNLQDPLLIPTGDATVSGSNDSSEPVYGGKVFQANKFHDYFTSCLPSPLKGQSVSIPFSGTMPVITRPEAWSQDVLQLYFKNNVNKTMMSWATPSGSGGVTTHSGTAFHYPNDVSSSGANLIAFDGNTSSATPSGYYNAVPSNLVAYTGDDLGSGSFIGVDVSALRFAVQMQRFLERLARGGSRYIEILKSMFGVTSPDARLQRSEYLGGNRVPISVHEVTNNSQSTTSPLGNLGAFSHTTDTNGDFTKSFVEHGYVIGVCVARYDHTYCQGLNRLWSRSSRESFYWPVFANLSEQAVYKNEIMFTTGISNDSVFGYQEAWAEYRYAPNVVSSEMRPQHPQSLASWNYADDYQSVPSLSAAWMAEDKTNVDRTLAVTSNVSKQILLDVYIQDHTSRVMPTWSVPGLVDHN